MEKSGDDISSFRSIPVVKLCDDSYSNIFGETNFEELNKNIMGKAYIDLKQEKFSLSHIKKAQLKSLFLINRKSDIKDIELEEISGKFATIQIIIDNIVGGNRIDNSTFMKPENIDILLQIQRSVKMYRLSVPTDLSYINKYLLKKIEVVIK